MVQTGWGFSSSANDLRSSGAGESGPTGLSNRVSKQQGGGDNEVPVPPRDPRQQASAVGVPLAAPHDAPPVARWQLESSIDHPYARFYAALLHPEVQVVDGSIELPGDVAWPGMMSSKLFVRHFYQDLWEQVLARGLGRLRGAAILGTPGIGKSAFGLYALFRAVKEGRPVVYHQRKGDSVLLINGRVYLVDPDRSIPELRLKETLYICDSRRPIGDGYAGAFTLLITSPKKENWSEFSKTQYVDRLVLPVYSYDEMQQLRALDFDGQPGCTREEVLQRFLKWGGSPRNVLTQATTLMWQAELDTCAYALSLPALLTAMKSQSSLEGVGASILHRILDLVPRGSLPDLFPGLTPDKLEYYCFHHAELLSAHIGGLFAEQLRKEESAALYSFLSLASSDPSSAGLRGLLYERAVVLPRLLNGKGASLQLERLSATTKISQPPLLSNAKLEFPTFFKCAFFQGVDDLGVKWRETQGDAIFVPSAKNFPVVDLVLRINGTVLLANATVSATHEVGVQNPTFLELLKVVGLSNGQSEIPLVWVLPRDAFDSFSEPGPLRGSNGRLLTSGEKARTPVGVCLAQYKLLLEVPSAEFGVKHTTAQLQLSGAAQRRRARTKAGRPHRRRRG